MEKLPVLMIKGKKIAVPIIQGGMGVGVSLYPLARAVALEGGVGIISSACLDRLVSRRAGRKVSSYEAAFLEVSSAKTSGGIAGINIMVALQRDYEASFRGALDAGADVIISGAGPPPNPTTIQDPRETAIIPIVSSARALEIICRKWDRARKDQKPYLPDAVVLEGPLAGGHLGFAFGEIDDSQYALENLLSPVKEVAQKYGNFPVIVAGGIYSNSDILRFMALGADAVQMGTRFLATVESSATIPYKMAVVRCREDQIIVVDPKYKRPGSPCKFPFRIITESPMYLSGLKKLRKPKCDKGYVLLKDENGNFNQCMAKEDNEESFCICNGLLSSAGYNSEGEEPLYTVGSNAYRIDGIVTVKTLMDELTGKTAAEPAV